jgi:hypothetical protein
LSGIPYPLNIVASSNASKKKETKTSTRQGLLFMIIIMNIHIMTSTELSMTAHEQGMTATDIQSLTALGLNTSLFDKVVSITDLGQLIINEETLLFEQSLNFELIFHELIKAKQLIETLNPEDFSDLVKLSGTTGHFKISNSLTSRPHASAKCFESGGILLMFEELIATKIKTNMTILLNNKILISDGNVKCISNKNSKIGIHCLSDWINWSIVSGKDFFKTDKELYSHLITNYKNSVLYMSVDENKMTVAPDPIGYTICRMLHEDKDYKEIIKAKYYAHMSSMIENLIDQYMLKLHSLEATFLRTIDKELLGNNFNAPVSEVCAIIKKLSFSHCVGLTVQSDDDWKAFFMSYRDTFLEIDVALLKIAQIFTKECSMNGNMNTDFIYKYFDNFLPMIKKTAKIRKSYDHQVSDELNRLIFRDRITPAEALSCTHQFARLHLSTKDSIRQLRMVYNIKLDFLTEFAAFVNLNLMIISSYLSHIMTVI